MKKLIEQITKFGLVGVIATVIDFLVLTLLVELFSVHYLIAAAAGFIISTLFNYYASMRYVFVSKYGPEERQKELAIFVALSVVGLGLNQVFMWLFVDQVYFHYIIAKVLATILVMIWNFVSRKIFLEAK